MKAATLQKNKHPASADNVVFSSMIDTFITRMNIKFIHVKWSTWSSFKVPSSWLRLFIFLSIICLIQQKETIAPISRRLNKKGNKYRWKSCEKLIHKIESVNYLYCSIVVKDGRERYIRFYTKGYARSVHLETVLRKRIRTETPLRHSGKGRHGNHMTTIPYSKVVQTSRGIAAV